MGAFEFVALDKAGKESKGLIEGDTPKHVRQILRERSLLPVKVTEVAQKEARRQRSFSLRRGISPGELALVTRQLASLSQSGLPLEVSVPKNRVWMKRSKSLSSRLKAILIMWSS